MNITKLKQVPIAVMVLAILTGTGCAKPDIGAIRILPDSSSGPEAEVNTEYVQEPEPTAENDGGWTTQNAPAAEENAAAAGQMEQTDTGDDAKTQDTQDASRYADAEQYPYYAQLSDQAKLVYQQLVEQISAGNAEIIPEAEIVSDELNDVISAVYREQPQLFWMENEWTWYSNERTGVVTSITVEFNELADQLDANIAAFQAAGAEALADLDGLPDAEKELAIHDYLAANTAYAQNALDQNAYSALVSHSSVCCGFTRAFQYLMQCEGIPAYFCQGTADGFSGGEAGADHAWCIVKLGDGYYNVDVTWDETSLSGQGLIVYNYFNRTDEVFALDHYRDESSEILPACTATEFSYEALRGMPAELGVTSQLNLDSSEPITTLDYYYQVMESNIIATGTGTHVFSYVVYGDACMNEISEAISANDIQAGFMDAAAAAIGLNGYSSTYNVQLTELGGGYYYVVQTIELSAS